MPNLTIYDSQGDPLGGGRKNERIENFFFDGVRLAIESMGRARAYCFFRARRSEGARLDQFYAEFEAGDVNKLGQLKSAVERRVTEEYDMILESSTEDATVFELFSDRQSNPPGDRKSLDAISDATGKGQQVKLGVGDYRGAVALLYEVVENSRDLNRIAIAENADSSELRDYDVIIEVGEHTGLVPLGDSQTTLERYKRTPQSSSGTSETASGGGVGGPGGQDGFGYDQGPDPDKEMGIKSYLIGYGVTFGVLLSILAVITGGAAYALCFTGTTLPGIGAPPGMDNTCGAKQPFTIKGGENSISVSWSKFESGKKITIIAKGPSDKKKTVTINASKGGKKRLRVNKSGKWTVKILVNKKRKYNKTVKVGKSATGTKNSPTPTPSRTSTTPSDKESSVRNSKQNGETSSSSPFRVTANDRINVSWNQLGNGSTVRVVADPDSQGSNITKNVTIEGNTESLLRLNETQLNKSDKWMVYVFLNGTKTTEKEVQLSSSGQS